MPDQADTTTSDRATDTRDPIDPGLVGRIRHRLAVSSRPVTREALTQAIQAEHSSPLSTDALQEYTAEVYAELLGAGPLQNLLADPEVTDVLVNDASGVWVDRAGRLERLDLDLGGPGAVRRLAQRLANACGRRLDDSTPFVDARLPDGTRLHAVLPPIAVNGPCLSLRTFRPRGFTFAELVASGSLTRTSAALLRAIVAARLAYLVTGGAGSGKTTLLSSMLGLVPPDERIVTIEDSVELCPSHPHVVALAARPPNAEGAGEVSMRDLVRQALRMRPDRLVVGECRGAEVVELLAALNTGHEGGAGTLHANRPADVPARLEALAALGGMPRRALHAQLGAAVQVIVHLRRTPVGRMVQEVCLLVRGRSHDLVETLPVWHRDHGPGPGRDRFLRLLTARDCPIPAELT